LAFRLVSLVVQKTI